MRYRLALSYRGTNYVGWQVQPNGDSIQGKIEEALFTICQKPLRVVGCGRTDAGVHAREYVAHLESEERLPDHALQRLNRLLPNDIQLSKIEEADPLFHARHDATQRGYRYHILARNDPFKIDLAYRYPHFEKINQALLHEAAQLLMGYDSFFPFCKTNSGVDHYRCRLHHSEWRIDEDQAVYHIQGNRFLRGMVRLIVGMCLNVATQKYPLEEVRISLDQQKPLNQSWSVPAHGLFLDQVSY
ncbi:MAG: tRNA pseudouridine(38-40) synthase TruA [Saprospiraceae bacterium]|nr:tRNA pseudouridine(38-40) synthase TruA [Saprospiraceae bacterium]